MEKPTESEILEAAQEAQRRWGGSLESYIKFFEEDPFEGFDEMVLRELDEKRKERTKKLAA